MSQVSVLWNLWVPFCQHVSQIQLTTCVWRQEGTETVSSWEIVDPWWSCWTLLRTLFQPRTFSFPLTVSIFSLLHLGSDLYHSLMMLPVSLTLCVLQNVFLWYICGTNYDKIWHKPFHFQLFLSAQYRTLIVFILYNHQSYLFLIFL